LAKNSESKSDKAVRIWAKAEDVMMRRRWIVKVKKRGVRL